MSPADGASPLPRIAALVALVAACALGAALVVTGRSTGEPHPTTSTVPSSATTTIVGTPLRSLGAVADEVAARLLLSSLEPATLQPRSEPSTSAGAPPASSPATGVTTATAKHCDAVVPHQDTNRAFGARLAAAQLRVGSVDRLVVAYDLPAAGDKPAARRVLLVDATSCQVLLAVDG